MPLISSAQPVSSIPQMSVNRLSHWLWARLHERRRAASAALFWLSVLTPSEPAFAVVGNASASDPELARHMVMVLKSGLGSAGFCSGVLIDRRIVLTAAHCVGSLQTTKVYANRDGHREFAAVVAIAMHPLYRPKAPVSRERSIDLALLRLDRRLQDYTPIALPDNGSVALGTRVQIAGFGIAREGDGRSGGVLRSGQLVVRAPASSILLWLADPEQRGTGACAGDSGGPILVGQALTAITNWAEGAGTAHCGTLTQAALLAPQRRWLEDILRSWSAP
jgi:Trypsin